MEASVGTALNYMLHGDGVDVVAVVAPDGAVERLTYTSQGAEPREFSGEEITHGVSPEGTRATVLLESGAADGPIVRASVMLPTIDSPEQGPFDISAGLLITTSPSLFGGVRPGPQQSYEAILLTGTVASAGSGSAYAPYAPQSGSS